MKILILEDDPRRIAVFKDRLKEHDLFFFTNVDDAKASVAAEGPFDRYFLDHDLDGRVYVDSLEPNTGYQLAIFLAERGESGEITVHSRNEYGAQNIKGIIPRAILVPFPELFPG